MSHTTFARQCETSGLLVKLLAVAAGILGIAYIVGKLSPEKDPKKTPGTPEYNRENNPKGGPADGYYGASDGEGGHNTTHSSNWLFGGEGDGSWLDVEWWHDFGSSRSWYDLGLVGLIANPPEQPQQGLPPGTIVNPVMSDPDNYTDLVREKVDAFMSGTALRVSDFQTIQLWLDRSPSDYILVGEASMVMGLYAAGHYVLP